MTGKYSSMLTFENFMKLVNIQTMVTFPSSTQEIGEKQKPNGAYFFQIWDDEKASLYI